MIRVCALSELDNRKPFAASVDDVDVVLVRDGERVHALADLCSHAAVSLSEGEVSRKGIECWLHGSCFDLETGKPSSLPATEPVDVYAVDIRDGDVFVDVTATTN
ncbi:3-phenylpropionate/trans-cinnamate dioxygenase ferredoxin subunit [Lentzea xinjiangensis]|uniref:3-phenylpropionate/trans-cinnamate dioxygenase ferredoxin subunit n=1 Tax=Lentzea xinjiangensis TaxID=402600 RepID=A0A1H9U843_9PSEU|nr:non-heme iron oxygenase ferredoxin subunit [Lentzea xinjiangensis]SES05492.1 3-phenylpropionate/trans-cinnamate dioxygenase ferredoxin subunit [Lentzea xinjiangensis]